MRNPLLEEGVSHVTATNSVELGTRRTVAGNDYIYVFNAGNSEIPPGYGAVLNAGAESYSATVSAVTSADMLLGVCKHTTLTTGTYGWLVDRGFVNVEMAAGSSATVETGGLIELGANGAFVPVSNTTGNAANACGKALNTIATGASGAAYIKAF